MSSYRRALAGAACLVVLGAGCSGCAKREEAAPAAPDAGTPRVKPFYPEDFGFLLISRSIGYQDQVNRYASAVLARGVTPEDGPHYRECAAVVVASNLVLTAAHCMCVLIGSQTLRFDGSQCAKKANVRTFVSVLSNGNDERAWQEGEIAGTISVHPRFELVLDAQGDVVSSRADLAAIRLEKPGVPEIQPVRLATRDVVDGELLSVAGYDYFEAIKSMFWYRRFTQEQVDTRVGVGDDRVQFGYMKFADFKGDTGGPCLRETLKGQELVGISQRGFGRTPTFTRIVPYREWVEEQIRLAGKRP
jgi:hypothetical protein